MKALKILILCLFCSSLFARPTTDFYGSANLSSSPGVGGGLGVRTNLDVWNEDKPVILDFSLDGLYLGYCARAQFILPFKNIIEDSFLYWGAGATYRKYQKYVTKYESEFGGHFSFGYQTESYIGKLAFWELDLELYEDYIILLPIVGFRVGIGF